MELISTALDYPFLGTPTLRNWLNHIHDHFIPHPRNNYHPHILGHRALALFSGLLVTVKIFAIALVAFGPILPAFSSAITPENIITLTNQSRKDYSLSAVTENNILNTAAKAKAEALLACQCFTHNLPDGRTPWTFFTAAGYNYLMAGENLAVNFTEAENVQTAWMNSPGHKANILNKNFQEIGIGVSQGEYQGHNAIIVVQFFGVPAEQPVALSNTPTVVQTQTAPQPAPIAQNTPVAEQSSPVATTPTAPVEPASPKPNTKTVVQAATPKDISAIRGVQTPPVAIAPQTPVEFAIKDGQINVTKTQANISANVSGAVKVLAYFGQSAVMLSPKDGTTWQGSIDLEKLARGNLGVKIVALDISGNQKTLQLADFSDSTISNYSVLGTSDQKSPQVSWLGRVFDVKSYEQKFYLLFIAGLLTSLILAIGIKRHIQHLPLIANSSFVAILAILLWRIG